MKYEISYKTNRNNKVERKLIEANNSNEAINNFKRSNPSAIVVGVTETANESILNTLNPTVQKNKVLILGVITTIVLTAILVALSIVSYLIYNDSVNMHNLYPNEFSEKPLYLTLAIIGFVISIVILILGLMLTIKKHKNYIKNNY
jgi:hypothetical protein